MKMTDFARRALAFRKQRRDLERKGYRMHETDPEIVRGGRHNDVILDAIISVDGKHVYTLLGTPESTP